MSKNIYVGNLPFQTNEEALRDLFARHGEVSKASLIADSYSGRSRGFGFVEMPNDSEALAAIESLNGTDLDGRKIVVNEARPKTERAGRESAGSGRRW